MNGKWENSYHFVLKNFSTFYCDSRFGIQYYVLYVTYAGYDAVCWCTMANGDDGGGGGGLWLWQSHINITNCYFCSVYKKYLSPCFAFLRSTAPNATESIPCVCFHNNII